MTDEFESTGFCDIDDMCKRLTELKHHGKIADWCEDRVRSICTSLHNARRLLTDARNENNVMRQMLAAHREFFAARQCRWMPQIGIQGAVRVGTDDQPCATCTDAPRLAEQIDAVIGEKGK